MSDIRLADFDHENVTNIINMLLSDQIEDVQLGASIVEEQFPSNWYQNALGFYFINMLVQSGRWTTNQEYNIYPTTSAYVHRSRSNKGVRDIKAGHGVIISYVY